jgi:DNA-binding transcriptional MerR regulator
VSVPDAAPEAEPERWPFGVSRTPVMSIGSALGLLQQEFPAVSISKVRFLEDQGIVTPHRTAAGYRTYSQADIERLRFALAAQRDSYLPWARIRDRLDELDAGTAGIPAPGARVVTEDGELTAAVARNRLTPEQLAESTGVDTARVAELDGAGLVSTDAGGKYPASATEIVRVAQQLAAHGVEVRHLRSMRTAAERQVDLVQQIVAPVRVHRSRPGAAGSRAAAQALAAELADAFDRMHAALVRAGIDRLS